MFVKSDLVINYYANDEEFARPLDINALIEEGDFKKINEIYQSIFSSEERYRIHLENGNSSKILKQTLGDLRSELYGNNCNISGQIPSIYSVDMLNPLGDALRDFESRLSSRKSHTELKETKFENVESRLYGRLKELEEQSVPQNWLSYIFYIFKYFLSVVLNFEHRKKEIRTLDEMHERAINFFVHNDPDQGKPSKIDQTLRKIKNRRAIYSRPISRQSEEVIRRSLELRERVKDTHYVINHGQNLDLMIINIAAKQFEKCFKGRQFNSGEILRDDTFLTRIDENIRTVEWYKKKIAGRVTDHNFRDELICGDAMLSSSAWNESALDFFLGSMNIASHLKKTLLTSIAERYISDKDVRDTLCRKLVKLIPYSSKGGNLYSMCIPKETFTESCYFSKPFGFAFPLEDPEFALNEMQEGTYSGSKIPQVRVLSHKLREEGCFTVVNSTLSREQISKIENEAFFLILAAKKSQEMKARDYVCA